MLSTLLFVWQDVPGLFYGQFAWVGLSDLLHYMNQARLTYFHTLTRAKLVFPGLIIHRLSLLIF